MALAWSILLSAGCRTPPPPPQPLDYATVQEAKRVVIERQQHVQSVQAECEIRVYPANEAGKSHGFDGAVVFAAPDRYRMRTWKLTQTLFDLTVNQDGTFIAVSDELTKRRPNAEDDLAKLAGHLNLLLRGPDFSQAEFKGEAGGPLRASWERGHAVINPLTLTPVSYFFEPGNDAPPIAVTTKFGDYPNGVWYHRVVAQGEFGTIELTFRDVRLNEELNPRAFRPPRRAVSR